jgi:transcriptional regulator with GAF, ATPase, and Fis domain
MLVADPQFEMIGVSAASRIVVAEIERAARSDAKVLITGKSGVGKEIAARLIHRLSHRADRAIVTINCAAVPDSLLESELFGHTRGSFTDAHRNRVGRFELGHHGTIFFDEVGEMSPRMQALLLRFLENGEIHRVGATDAAPPGVDVRVIAATNRNLADRIASGHFREDLYYRLNVININIPPPCQRPEDIPVLLRHFFAVYAGRHGVAEPDVSVEALTKLVVYDWPGNVRELKNVVERLTLQARARSAPISPSDLPPEIAMSARPTPHQPPPATSKAQAIFDRMVEGREPFWSAVHSPFMTRDLTRSDVREIVAKGFQTAGNYKSVARLFNLPPLDYKRFMNFLRTHGCDIRFQPLGDLTRQYRSAYPAVRAEAADRRPARES